MNASMNAIRIAGYASVFGIKDLAGDVVQRGAFAQSLKELPAASIRMLYQHDPKKPIGEWISAKEDDVGLWVEGYLFGHDANSRLARTLISGGEMDGLSIGFRTLEFRPLDSGGRILKTIDLREISLVAYPMLPRTRLRVIAEVDKVAA